MFKFTNKRHFKIIVFLFLFIFTFSNIIASNSPDLHSKNAIILDNDSGKVIYEKGGYDKIYPASTTKVLTAILVLENLDISNSTVVSKEAVQLPYGSSNAALIQGEVMSIEDLLYAMMLKSGNDCANVLAEAVSGSIDNFVILMNEKLKEIGCSNTNFANAHGYHDANHYSTPYDMAKLLSYAMKNEKFVKITSTSSYTIEPTNKTTNKRIYQNTNRLILTKDDSYLSRYYEYCIGGKTGYTDEAGRTLLAYGEKDNKNLIIGVFNGPVTSSEDVRYTDTINLFEYGFNNFEKTKIIEKNDYLFSYTDNNKNVIYTYSLADDIYALTLTSNISSQDINTINYTVDLNYDKLNQYDINSSDYKNQVIGSIDIIFRQDNLIHSKNFNLTLINIEEIPVNFFEFNNIIKIVVILLLTIFIIYMSFFIRSKKKRIKKSKKHVKYAKSSSANNYDINFNYRTRTRK